MSPLNPSSSHFYQTFITIRCHCSSVTHNFHIGVRNPTSPLPPSLPLEIHTDTLSRSLSGQLVSTYAFLPPVLKVDVFPTIFTSYKHSSISNSRRKAKWKFNLIEGGESNRERQKRTLAQKRKERGASYRAQAGIDATYIAKETKYDRLEQQLQLQQLKLEEENKENQADEQDEEGKENEEEDREEEEEAAEEIYYFCKTCGAHVYLHASLNGWNAWSVSTGLLSNTALIQRTLFRNKIKSALSSLSKLSAVTTTTHPLYGNIEVLPASCACKSVRFNITRPSTTSSSYNNNNNNSLKNAAYPDLINPHHTFSSSNPNDEKWWVCHPPPPEPEGGKPRYLAGTCMCTTCRTTSGFPIQFWCFVPKENILLQDCSSTVPDDLIFGGLKSYKSREDVRRLFCGTCGCTVFYQNTERPELIDVSVGVLEAVEMEEDGGGGAGRRGRYGDWLCWWKDRVSFSEDAVDEELKEILEECIKEW